MLHFDYECEFVFHGLIQSLLPMIRDDHYGLQYIPRDITSHKVIDLFCEIREMLTIEDVVFRSFNIQVVVSPSSSLFYQVIYTFKSDNHMTTLVYVLAHMYVGHTNPISQSLSCPYIYTYMWQYLAINHLCIETLSNQMYIRKMNI
jgi:hypothetical protein